MGWYPGFGDLFYTFQACASAVRKLMRLEDKFIPWRDEFGAFVIKHLHNLSVFGFKLREWVDDEGRRYELWFMYGAAWDATTSPRMGNSTIAASASRHQCGREILVTIIV